LKVIAVERTLKSYILQRVTCGSEACAASGGLKKVGQTPALVVPSNPWNYLLDRSILLRFSSDDCAARKAKTT